MIQKQNEGRREALSVRFKRTAAAAMEKKAKHTKWYEKRTIDKSGDSKR